MRPLTFLLYVVLSGLGIHLSYAQRAERIVMYDQKGRLITTEANTSSSRTSTVTYLGSSYLGNTVWHQGSLIFRNQQAIPAQLAYNIVSDQVFWRPNDSTQFTQALPDEFMFEGHRFISEHYKPLGINRIGYYEILYDGKTKLLCKWTKQLRFIDHYSIRVGFDDRFAGEYILTKDLYIQKEGKRPKFIIPNEYWLSWRLPDMGSELANFIASHELTDQVLIEALIQYDKRHFLSKQTQ